MAIRAKSRTNPFCWALAGLGLIALLAGCAAQSPGSTASPAPPSQGPTMSKPLPTPPVPTTGETSSPGSEPSAGDQLTIRYDNGRGSVETWTLTCDPIGGDHPDPKAACQALLEHEAALQPVPPDQACTEQYGGPDTAAITGTWRGKPVNAHLSRTNGCEMSRWDQLAGLLPRSAA